LECPKFQVRCGKGDGYDLQLRSLKVTASLPLKIGRLTAPKRKCIFQQSIFRGYVSFLNVCYAQRKIEDDEDDDEDEED